MALTVTKQDPYDAFELPDGFVMYRHEYAETGKPMTPEALEKEGIHVYQKGTPDWERVTKK